MMEQRLIDANALKEEISSLSITVTGISAGKSILRGVLLEYRKTVLRIIEEQPTIEAEPVQHGRWVLGYVEPGYCTPGGNRPWICSECGRVISWRLDKPMEKYCSNCGAKMKED